MKIGIVNDMPHGAEALRRAAGARARARSRLERRQMAAEAVDLCARDTPDLVLMDLDHAGHGWR